MLLKLQFYPQDVEIRMGVVEWTVELHSNCHHPFFHARGLFIYMYIILQCGPQHHVHTFFMGGLYINRCVLFGGCFFVVVLVRTA